MNIKSFRLIFLIAVALYLTPAPLEAITFETGESLHISNLHKIEDDLFVWTENVTIDGFINGDLFGGGFKVSTNGEIKYSANIAAYDYNHTGKINGGLRTFANSATIDGYVGRSAMISGSDVTIGNRAVIEKDLVVVGEMLNLKGIVKGNSDIKGKNIFLTGTFEGDVKITGENIKILPPTLIKGDLSYTSENQAELDLTSGVTILGNTTWDLPEDTDDTGETSDGWNTFVIMLSKMLATFFFGIILLAISRRYLAEAYSQLKNRMAVSLATGLLTVVIAIFSLVILIFSIIFMVVGSLLIGGDSSFTGAVLFILATLLVPLSSIGTVSGGIVFYSGIIMIGLGLGYFLVKLMKPQATFLSRTQLFIGLAIVTIIYTIPVLGWIFYFLASITGAGAIILGIKHCRFDDSQTDDQEKPTPLGA